MKVENDYKKQIRELQSALATERHKNSAMAKGLIPKEYLHEYTRIQIEKDRERVKLNARVKMMSYPIGDHVIVDPESIDNTPINLD